MSTDSGFQSQWTVSGVFGDLTTDSGCDHGHTGGFVRGSARLGVTRSFRNNCGGLSGLGDDCGFVGVGTFSLGNWNSGSVSDARLLVARGHSDSVGADGLSLGDWDSRGHSGAGLVVTRSDGDQSAVSSGLSGDWNSRGVGSTRLVVARGDSNSFSADGLGLRLRSSGSHSGT